MKKTVQTVVLAGGFGTRLLPITENKPKPLVRILDKTVLETVLEKAVGNVTVSAYYLWEKTANECRRIDEKITCKREMIPLGTAGAVKNCYDGISDVILVLSGDAVFDFDLEKALEFHFETNSDVTVVTTHKKDPTSFGIVVSGKGGKIRHFTEKPDWERVVTGRINTGIYILNKEILNEIPDNIQYDFAKNLFPKLLSKGTELYSFEADGFWCDIGTPGEYLLCNSLAARGEVKSVKNNGVDITALNKSGIFADGGVYVGRGVTTGKNIKLGKGSVVCENVLLSDNCDLERCVVSKGTTIGSGSSISGSVVGERVIIGENCIVPDGCIIGDEAVISDGTVLKSSIKIGYREVVGKGDVSAVEFKNDKRLFVSRGVAVLDSKRIFDEVMHFADAVLKSIKEKRAGVDVAVMCSFGEIRVKEAVLRALVSKGCDVFDMNEGTADMCAYGGKMCKSDVSIFLCSSGTNLTVRVFDKDGNVIDVKTEKEIEKNYNCSRIDESQQLSLNIGRCFNVPMSKLYENMLCSFVSECLSQDSFKDLSVCISNCNGTRILTDVIESFEGKIQPCREGMLKIGLANIDGECFARQNEIICDSHHIRAVVMKNIEILGTGAQDYASYSTEALLRIATFKGVSQSGEVKYPLFSDNFLLLLCLLCIIKKTGKSFSELYEEIPSFELFIDELVGINDRAEIMEKLSGSYSCDSYDRDGVKLKLAQGTVTVIPSRIAGFKIISEAVNAETARELCLKIEDVIKDNSKDKK